MKLHLAAEDVEDSLNESSLRALQRIPAAVQEVSHLKVNREPAGNSFVIRHDFALHSMDLCWSLICTH